MIPLPWVEAWRSEAPWTSSALVEQDLVISRALVDVFRVPELAAGLAFRGGTALHKLHLKPGSRYSEDIDLVQTVSGPIGPVFDRIRAALDPWLGTPSRDQKGGRMNLVYRFTSQDMPQRPLRLKIEINSREHFSVLGHVRIPFQVQSDWYVGAADVTSFQLDELMGTKLRALYQRSKGRDLFDLALALERGADPGRVVACFVRYIEAGGHHVTRRQFEENLVQKCARDAFRGDLSPLLRTGVKWDADAAVARVRQTVVPLLPEL